MGFDVKNSDLYFNAAWIGLQAANISRRTGYTKEDLES
jgi:hypothetical protein